VFSNHHSVFDIDGKSVGFFFFRGIDSSECGFEVFESSDMVVGVLLFEDDHGGGKS